MTDGAQGPPAARAIDAYPRAVVEATLAKVLGSAVFRRSARHRRFLHYIVQATLDNDRDRLKEGVLGIALFDRRPDRYDPREDPIVRVEAGRVRQKLARYYDGEGAGDPFAFTIPVGGYVPMVERILSSPAAAGPVETFAVLPFASDGTEQNVAFTIGLADRMINLLGRVRDVKVIARMSAFAARERHREVRDIGKLLKVTRVVDGSVQRHGDRLRCIAHTYRARDGALLWSRSFDSKTDGLGVDGCFDLFDFQDFIADALIAAVAPTVETRHPPAAAESPEALVAGGRRSHRHQARDLLERASYLARQYDAGHADQVVTLLEQSIALDPDHAQAHVALATAFLHRSTLIQSSGSAMLPKMEASLRRALALDSSDSDAIALRAMIAFRFEFDWPRSEQLFRDALRISPHASNVNYRFAFGLMMNGRFDEGLRHARIAVELDPLNLGLRAHAAQLTSFTRDYASAEASARDVLELEPMHLYMNYVLASIDLYRRDVDRALARFDRLIAAYPADWSVRLGRVCALGMRGDVAQGQAELDALLRDTRDRHCPLFGLARAQYVLGDRPLAWATLERSAQERDSSFCSLPIDPLFAPSHDDPAFRSLLSRHGLRPPVP